MNKVGIVIVTYNVPTLVLRQIECVRKYGRDKDCEIVIVDNSNEPEAIDGIRHFAGEAGVRLIKTVPANLGGSESHVFACNLSYFKLRDEYDYFLYLDHDNFPVRDFSVIETLAGRNMAGLGQQKSKLYYWPGCVMWNNRAIDNDIIDFSCSHELGLDTGGLLYKAIESVGIDTCGFFNEKYYENPYFKGLPYNFYSTINDDMFMHFINSSGWNPTDGNTDRINSLLSILYERTND